MALRRKHDETLQPNITKINNDYTFEKNLEKQQTTIQVKKAKRRRNMLALIAALVLLPLGRNLADNVSQIREVEEQIELATAEKKALEEENQRLNVQVGLLQDDEYVAKLARSRYYFSKDDEIIFSLPEDNQSKAANKVGEQN